MSIAVKHQKDRDGNQYKRGENDEYIDNFKSSARPSRRVRSQFCGDVPHNVMNPMSIAWTQVFYSNCEMVLEPGEECDGNK